MSFNVVITPIVQQVDVFSSSTPYNVDVIASPSTFGVDVSASVTPYEVSITVPIGKVLQLTTLGTSGPAEYNGISGVLNIPNYTTDISGLVPKTRTLTINGTTFDLSQNRAWTVGDLLSSGSYNNPSWITGLAWSKITGLPTTLAGYGITDAYTKTEINSFFGGSTSISGYNKSNWDTAYNSKINSVSVTGDATKTLTLTKQDGSTIVASWTDKDTNLVSSVFGRTGPVTAQSGDYNTSLITENTNLYFTQARVLSSSLTGFTVGTDTALTNTNTVLEAFQNLQGQMNARLSGLGTAGQISYWDGVKSLTGSPNFTWNNSTSTLDVVGNFKATGTLEVDTVNNGTGDFVTIGAGGVFTKRTASQTLDDIGASSVAQVTPITVLASSFALVSGLYEASIANAGILSTSIVDVIPSNASYTIVKDAEFLPQTLSSAGSVKVYCVNLPAGDITVTINITNP